ncbi:hypothetical protein [Dyella sp. 2RAB6]|uniref:hypothetical protein n=1 Tax=Dyella sp. 2RAB6 TaxID=3232992 RepID=UPI003F92DC84
MSMSVFVPMLTSIGTVLIILFLNTFGTQSAADLSRRGIYVVGKGIRVFIFCGTIGFVLMPFVFVYLGTTLKESDWLVGFAVDAAMITSLWYAVRYRLEVHASFFSLQSFARRKVDYRDVSSIKWRFSSRGNRYLVVGRQSRRALVISGTVQNIDEFATELGKRCDLQVGRE